MYITEYMLARFNTEEGGSRGVVGVHLGWSLFIVIYSVGYGVYVYVHVQLATSLWGSSLCVASADAGECHRSITPYIFNGICM